MRFIMRAMILAALFADPVQAQTGPVAAGETVRAAKGSPLFQGEFTASQLQQRQLATIRLQPGIELNLRQYLDTTRLTQSPKLAPLFQQDVQTRFLKAAPSHSENIIQLTDRLVVNRELKVELRPEACRDAQAPAAVTALCFRRKAGRIPTELAGSIQQIRQRLATAPDDRIVKLNVTVAQARRLSDSDLMDLLLNSDAREIRHVTVIPLQIHPVELGAGLKPAQRRGITSFERPLLAAKPFKTFVEPATPLPGERIGPRGEIPGTKATPRPGGEQKAGESVWSLTADELQEFVCRQNDILAKRERKRTTLTDEEMRALAREIRGSGERSCREREVARREQREKLRKAWEKLKAERAREEAREKAEKAEQARRAKETLDRILGIVVSAAEKQQEKHEKSPLSFETRYFLTGEHWGREIEDDFEYTFADSTWLTDRYYVRFSYWVGAVFALRLPYSVTVSASPMRELREGRGAPAKGREISVVVSPVNVETAYPAVGLPGKDPYEGREFVFGFSAGCEFKASIPGPNVNIPCPSIEEMRSRNLKPVLGKDSADIGSVWLRGNVTGLGINAWMGGAFLDLGVGVEMTSGKIGYRVTPHSSRTIDLKADKERNVLVKSGGEGARTEKFGLIPEREGTNWGFRIDRPKYSFRVEIIPQMQIRLNLDLGVYEFGDTIGPLSFDSLTIDESFEVGKYEETKGAYDFGM